MAIFKLGQIQKGLFVMWQSQRWTFGDFLWNTGKQVRKCETKIVNWNRQEVMWSTGNIVRKIQKLKKTKKKKTESRTREQNQTLKSQNVGFGKFSYEHTVLL